MKKTLLILFCILFQVSCGKVLYVSVPCKVSVPTRPTFSDNTVQNVKDLLIYTEILESTLKVCVDGR